MFQEELRRNSYFRQRQIKEENDRKIQTHRKEIKEKADKIVKDFNNYFRSERVKKDLITMSECGNKQLIILSFLTFKNKPFRIAASKLIKNKYPDLPKLILKECSEYGRSFLYFDWDKKFLNIYRKRICYHECLKIIEKQRKTISKNKSIPDIDEEET